MSRLPIEELDERAWARVEAGVRAELAGDRPAPVEVASSGRTRGWAVAALGVAAAAVLAFVFVSRAPDEMASAQIVTAEAGTTSRLGEATLRVGPNASLTAVGSDGAGYVVVLERGRVVFEVPSRSGRPPFRVSAGEVRVEVVGTRFAVSREPTGEVEVSVSRGAVRVTAGDLEETLSAGGRWAHPARVVAARPPEGSPEPVSEGRGDEAEGATPARLASSTAGEGRAPPAVSRPERFAQASGLEASDPLRADAIYRELSRGRDGWAANALFARGRLAAERGQADRASIHLRAYLGRFPTGPNAADARRLLAAEENER